MKDKINLNAPFLILTDSYKAGHARMYPHMQAASAYVEFRGSLGDVYDDRILFYGVRYLYEKYLSRVITMNDILEADDWYEHHGVLGSKFYYPRDIWLSVVNDCNGKIPLTIKALRDGSVIYPHVPVIQVTANGDKYAPIVTWLETIISHIWSPTVTATKSRMVLDFLDKKFEKSVDQEFNYLLKSRFHDFGFRGVSSVETAMTTGIGHLISFDGTDTQVAGWLAKQFNDGRSIGESVLASEHSVMTAYDNELEAVLSIINSSEPGSIVSIVADSTDYDWFLDNIVPKIVEPARAKNIFIVIRPDSGEPIIQVEKALLSLEKYFGFTLNKKGFKVINGAGVICGDGLDLIKLFRIADQVEYLKYSAQCVAYGMGGGLLQSQTRDTLRLATKLSSITFDNGRKEDRMKRPKTDPSKNSLPGTFKVFENSGGLTVYPEESIIGWKDGQVEINKLETIWDCGETNYKFESFDSVRERANSEWSIRPKFFDVISDELKNKQAEISKKISERELV